MCYLSTVFENDTITLGKCETTIVCHFDLGRSWQCALIFITYPNSLFFIKKKCIVPISGLYRGNEKALFSVYAKDNSDQKLVMDALNWADDESSNRRKVTTNQPIDYKSCSTKYHLNLFPETIK